MMTHVHVERLEHYSDDDAAQLGRILPFLSANLQDKPIPQEILEKIIYSESRAQIVARIEGRIVGAATMNLTVSIATGEKGMLDDFVTDPEVRKLGIGDKIWEEMERWCREQGVNLDFTSHPSREAAHRFYLNHGAVIRETTVFHKEVE